MLKAAPANIMLRATLDENMLGAALDKKLSLERH